MHYLLIITYCIRKLMRIIFSHYAGVRWSLHACFIYMYSNSWYWISSHLVEMVREFIGRDFVSCGVKVLKSRRGEKFKLFIMLAWAIWSNRNIIVHGDEGRDTKLISFKRV